MDVFLISCLGSASFDVPGFWFIMPASMISMWVGLNLVIGSMKLSGTVSASIKKTDSETLFCRFLTISTPTKSSLRNGFPMPATTTLSAPENHFFREFSMSTVCSLEQAMSSQPITLLEKIGLHTQIFSFWLGPLDYCLLYLWRQLAVLLMPFLRG